MTGGEVQLAHGAERMGQRVDGAEPFLEGHGAFQRAHHHLPAGLAVGAVGHRASQHKDFA